MCFKLATLQEILANPTYISLDSVIGNDVSIKFKPLPRPMSKLAKKVKPLSSWAQQLRRLEPHACPADVSTWMDSKKQIPIEWL